MQNVLTATTVEIRNVPDTKVALLEHRGNPETVLRTLRSFIEWRKQAGLPPARSATFNIWYDDPDHTDPKHFRLGLCAATDLEIQPNPQGVVPSVIPGGRCAVLRSVGPDDAVKRDSLWLYSEWLPNSGEEPRDFPPYCQRISFGPEIPESEAITDIFIPLL